MGLFKGPESHTTGVLMRRDRDTDAHRGTTTRGHGEEMAMYKLEDTDDTLILDFQPPAS